MRTRPFLPLVLMALVACSDSTGPDAERLDGRWQTSLDGQTWTVFFTPDPDKQAAFALTWSWSGLTGYGTATTAGGDVSARLRSAGAYIGGEITFLGSLGGGSMDGSASGELWEFTTDGRTSHMGPWAARSVAFVRP